MRNRPWNAEEGGWVASMGCEFRSAALGPGWLESEGDGEMPAGIRKGELTGGAAVDTVSIYPLSTGVSPDGIIRCNSGGIRSGLDGTRAGQELYFVSSHRVERTLPAPHLPPAGGFQSNSSVWERRGYWCCPWCFAHGPLSPNEQKIQGHQKLGWVLGTSMANRSPQTHKPTCAWRRLWEGWRRRSSEKWGYEEEESASHPPPLG